MSFTDWPWFYATSSSFWSAGWRSCFCLGCCYSCVRGKGEGGGSMQTLKVSTWKFHILFLFHFLLTMLVIWPSLTLSGWEGIRVSCSHAGVGVRCLGLVTTRGLGGSFSSGFLTLSCCHHDVFFNSVVPVAASGSPPSWWWHSLQFFQRVSSRLFWESFLGDPSRVYFFSPFGNFGSTTFPLLKQWFLLLALRHDWWKEYCQQFYAKKLENLDERIIF